MERVIACGALSFACLMTFFAFYDFGKSEDIQAPVGEFANVVEVPVKPTDFTTDDLKFIACERVKRSACDFMVECHLDFQTEEECWKAFDDQEDYCKPDAVQNIQLSNIFKCQEELDSILSCNTPFPQTCWDLRPDND